MTPAMNTTLGGHNISHLYDDTKSGDPTRSIAVYTSMLAGMLIKPGWCYSHPVRILSQTPTWLMTWQEAVQTQVSATWVEVSAFLIWRNLSYTKHQQAPGLLLKHIKMLMGDPPNLPMPSIHGLLSNQDTILLPLVVQWMLHPTCLWVGPNCLPSEGSLWVRDLV